MAISSVINLKNNTVLVHSEEVTKVGTRFEPGFYLAVTDERGNINISKEKLPEIHSALKTKETELVLNTAQSFFCPDIREKVNTMGFTHKLGILLYGIYGSGKTSVLNFIADEFITNKEAVVLLCKDGNSFGTAIALGKKIREIQENPLIFIADEFERFAESEESKMKSFLDGVDSIDNSLFLSATNYVEKVPDTIKDRPSRIRLLVEFKGIEDKEVMKSTLKEISDKLQPSLFSEEEIETAFDEISSITIDQIKSMCLDKLTETYVKTEKKTIGFKREEKKEKVAGLSWMVSFDESVSSSVQKQVEQQLS